MHNNSTVTNIIDPIKDRTNMEPHFLRWDLSKRTTALSNVNFDDAISKAPWNARLVDNSDSSEELDKVTTARKKKDKFDVHKRASMKTRPRKKAKVERKKWSRGTPRKQEPKIPDFFMKNEDNMSEHDYRSASEDDEGNASEFGSHQRLSGSSEEDLHRSPLNNSTRGSKARTKNLGVDDDVESVPLSPFERDYVSATPSPAKMTYGGFKDREPNCETEREGIVQEDGPHRVKTSRRRLKRLNRDDSLGRTYDFPGELEDDSTEIDMTPEKGIKSAVQEMDDKPMSENEKQGVSNAPSKTGRVKLIARKYFIMRARLQKGCKNDNDNDDKDDDSASVDPCNVSPQSVTSDVFQSGRGTKEVEDTEMNTKHKASAGPEQSSATKKIR